MKMKLAAVIAAIPLGWILFLRPAVLPSDAEVPAGAVVAGLDQDTLVVRLRAVSSPDRLYAGLMDVENYGKLFPRVTRMKKLTSHDSEVSAYGRISLLGPLTVSFSFVAHGEMLGADRYRISWEGAGTSLRSNTGSWEISPTSDKKGSIVTYRIRLVPEARMIPARAWGRIELLVVPGALKPLTREEI
jgi:hypothetical protein